MPKKNIKISNDAKNRQFNRQWEKIGKSNDSPEKIRKRQLDLMSKYYK